MRIFRMKDNNHTLTTVGGITIDDIDIDTDSIPVTSDFNPLNNKFDDRLTKIIDTTDTALNDFNYPAYYIIFLINYLTDELCSYFSYSREKYITNNAAFRKLVSPLDKLDILKDYDIWRKSYPEILTAWDYARYIVREDKLSAISNYSPDFLEYCKLGAVGELTYQSAIDDIQWEQGTFLWADGFEQDCLDKLNTIREYKTTLKAALEEIYPVIDKVDAEKAEQVRKIYQLLDEQLAYELVFAHPLP